jgi:hypothetical protein
LRELRVFAETGARDLRMVTNRAGRLKCSVASLVSACAATFLQGRSTWTFRPPQQALRSAPSR